MPQPVVPPLPTTPFHQFPYTDRLMPEHVNLLVSKIPKRFLMDDEISLLLWVVAENETSIAFDNSERGTYKSEYFPDYVITVGKLAVPEGFGCRRVQQMYSPK